MVEVSIPHRQAIGIYFQDEEGTFLTVSIPHRQAIGFDIVNSEIDRLVMFQFLIGRLSALRLISS
ncbi:Hypothetical protein DEACI_3857 [Acididesulfobacillus acetoxydans]|uniref:DUF2283 domain-containing protein n=1 Tax=Acididesulfobacillus acetoxydans TaxID=1561005 RepID=A0ABP1XKV5_9FIRM|nr:Hypothetical protein DEACI_3857 [Acididesulfobacillus acetoxydans]